MLFYLLLCVGTAFSSNCVQLVFAVVFIDIFIQMKVVYLSI